MLVKNNNPKKILRLKTLNFLKTKRKKIRKEKIALPKNQEQLKFKNKLFLIKKFLKNNNKKFIPKIWIKKTKEKTIKLSLLNIMFNIIN